MIFYSDTLIEQWLAGSVDLKGDRFGYDNILRNATLTASTTQSGFNVSTLRNGQTQIYYRPTAYPATVDIEANTNAPVNFVAFAGHDLFTHSVTVILQGYDGSNYQDIISMTPDSDRPFAGLFTPMNYSDYRLRFESGESTYFSLAVAYLGRVLEMPRGPEFNYTPIELSRDDDLIPQYSHSGGFQGAIVERKGNSSSVMYNHLTNAFYRQEFDPFIESASSQARPFFYIGLPEPSLVEASLVLNFAEQEYLISPAYSGEESVVAFVRLPEGAKIAPSKGPNNGRLSVMLPMEGLVRG